MDSAALCVLLLTLCCFQVTFGSPLEDALRAYNQELRDYQQAEAEVAWNISLGEDLAAWETNKRLSIVKNLWRNEWCERLSSLLSHHQLEINVTAEEEERREVYLACRGPKFTSYHLSSIISLLTKMDKIYSSTRVFGMRMEPELNRLMETSRDERMLRAAWSQWHHTVGTELRPLYVKLVEKLNRGARNAGYSDFGEVWRAEMETADLVSKVARLYQDVLPLYKLLHAYVRWKLGSFYNLDLQGLIPAHLLGNMWAQKWDGLMDLVYSQGQAADESKNPLIRELIKAEMLTKNSSLLDLVRTAEKFYISMGFPQLPTSFYEKSYFTEDPSLPLKNCHGTAANMFSKLGDDYRVMMCIGKEPTDEDLVTVTHEMGHVYYFMAYANQKPIFQDGANAAFHESVGDCLTYGLKSSKDPKQISIENLLKIGLARLPQIGFGLVMDLWRWHVFENEEESPAGWNEYWWELQREILGISPPANHHTQGLDATGKYHIVQNIPYIRYFLSSFLQLQFFQALCKHGGYEDMHECQLRGNKRAGYKLWKMMESGSSEHWSKVLKELTGSESVDSGALLTYFQPLKAWLEEQIATHRIPVGW